MNSRIKINVRNLYIFLFCFLFLTFKLLGQDIQFTQFYAAPTYLNPAFTGANACSRLSTNYRDQWPSLPGTFVSYTLSYDHYVPSLSSGIGFLLTNDKAGSGNLRTTNYNLLYAYQLPIGRRWVARMGFQGAYAVRGIDFFKLVFGDQIAHGGTSTSVQPPSLEKVSYFDVSSGLLLYSGKDWFGFAAHHLNRPNQSLLDQESPLPVKYSFHAGTNFKVGDTKREQDQSISPAINYKAQGKFDQLDIGIYFNKTPMVWGMWYRGIPLFKAYKSGYANNDALALLLGLDLYRLRIGYSYDITISRLVSSTGGAHEVSLSYQFCDPKARKRKKRIVINCPKF